MIRDSYFIIRNGIRQLSIHRSSETLRIPTRLQMLNEIKNTSEFDMIVIGGGSSGAGVALDAAMRGLKVACIEREDFASGTSSRSTKLIWGGSRYLVQALVTLFHPDLRLIREPKKTIQSFMTDFRMVLNCHRERSFFMNIQPHLTNWIPIAVPISKWLLWPPPFGHPIAALGPLGIFPVFFKFYDFLSGFNCPPSHVMNRKRTLRKFPQLSIHDLKYCSIFYEGQHDDARTNLCLAETAAMEGAVVLNYMNVVQLLRNDNTTAVQGIVAEDTLTNTKYTIKSKVIVSCCGPFADEINQMPGTISQSPNKLLRHMVKGAAGVHVVLPSYYAPSGIGLVDMNTTDGRFLFLLPWEGNVLVGTTDRKVDHINMRPIPTENEIKWLLNEAAKYLNKEVMIRRQDVLSAWCGIRPLVSADLNTHGASENGGATSTASRDYVIYHDDPSAKSGSSGGTGIAYVLGGKWTTYREMAEDAVDKAIKIGKLSPLCPSRTLYRSLIGREGYSPNLPIKLTQEYDIPIPIATALVHRYGGRARDVLEIAKEMYVRSQQHQQRTSESLVSNNKPQLQRPMHQQPHSSASAAVVNDHMHRSSSNIPGRQLCTRIIPSLYYIEAEIVYATRYEWAVHAEDVLARRTRIAFLTKADALLCIDRIVTIMGNELQWDENKRELEREQCTEFLRSFGGPVPLHEHTNSGVNNQTSNKFNATSDVRIAAPSDILQVLQQLDKDSNGYILSNEVKTVGEMLSYPVSREEIQSCIYTCDRIGTGKIGYDAFIAWWNSEQANPNYKKMREDATASWNW